MRARTARLNAFLARHVAPLQEAGFSNAALDKTLAAVGGWAPVGTRLRWPYRSVPAQIVTRLRTAALDELHELVAQLRFGDLPFGAYQRSCADAVSALAPTIPSRSSVPPNSPATWTTYSTSSPTIWNAKSTPAKR